MLESCLVTIIQIDEACLNMERKATVRPSVLEIDFS